MDEININYIEDFENFRRKNIFNIPNVLFVQYLNVLFPNLVLREDNLSETKDLNRKTDLSSFYPVNNKHLLDKTISINTFSQYMGIQNLISERIYKYIDKSKKGKMSKNDFCEGLHQIFFGNIIDLTKLTFFICDFNEDNKIYKSDMKLILSYIPKNSKNLNQQEYIKSINKIIDEFFKEIKEEYSQSDEFNEEEINYNLYLTKINDAIDESNINGAFFLFINLIKYIFICKPFNYETIYSVNYAKNKHLLKANVQKIMNLKNVFQNKNFAMSERYESSHLSNNFNMTNSNNINNSEYNKLGIVRTTAKKNTDYKIFENNYNMEKMQKKNLFGNKSNSTSKNVREKFKIKNHNYIVAKKKESDIENNDDFNKLMSELDNKTKYNNNRNAPKNRMAGGKTLSYNKLNNRTFRVSSKNNTIFIKSKENNGTENKNNILPPIYNYSPQKKRQKNNIIQISPNKNKNLKLMSSTLKLKNKIISPASLIPMDNKYQNKNMDENDYNYINSEKKNEHYLYKYSEEDNFYPSLKKYYAVINEKEILFYSSNLKNELCCIWNFNNTIISIPDKASVNKIIYYPIKIIYVNNVMSVVFFEDKEDQIEFGNILKLNIGNKNYNDEFEDKEKLGEGHFGVVKKCTEKKSGKEYAVKIISKKNLMKEDLELIIQEKNYMKLIKHPNIVGLIADFEDENYIYLVMNYYKGGDLYAYIKEYRNNDKLLPEKIIAKIIKIIAQSIQYLNYFGIVHRDLKPENIVFGNKEDISSLAIIDLGVAITLSYGQTNNEPLGTLEYIPPEIFTRKPYSHKVDIWSLGIILYILVTCGKIYPFDCDIKDKEKGEKEKIIGKKIVFLQQEYPTEYFGNKSKYLISLIDKALEKSPEKRISIDDFLNNYWLVNTSK